MKSYVLFYESFLLLSRIFSSFFSHAVPCVGAPPHLFLTNDILLFRQICHVLLVHLVGDVYLAVFTCIYHKHTCTMLSVDITFSFLLGRYIGMFTILKDCQVIVPE